MVYTWWSPIPIPGPEEWGKFPLTIRPAISKPREGGEKTGYVLTNRPRSSELELWSFEICLGRRRRRENDDCWGGWFPLGFFCRRGKNHPGNHPVNESQESHVWLRKKKRFGENSPGNLFRFFWRVSWGPDDDGFWGRKKKQLKMWCFVHGFFLVPWFFCCNTSGYETGSWLCEAHMCFTSVEIVEAFLEQLVFWHPKKKNWMDSHMRDRCGEMFHKQPTKNLLKMITLDLLMYFPKSASYPSVFNQKDEFPSLSQSCLGVTWLKIAFGWDMSVRRRVIGEFGVYVDSKSVNVQHHQLSKSH